MFCKATYISGLYAYLGASYRVKIVRIRCCIMREEGKDRCQDSRQGLGYRFKLHNE